MATKNFGATDLQPRDIGAEAMAAVHKLVGENVPVKIGVLNDKIVQFSFDTEWQEGGTTPVVDMKTKQVTGYKEDYTTKKLSAAQVAKLEKWAKENVVA